MAIAFGARAIIVLDDKAFCTRFQLMINVLYLRLRYNSTVENSIERMYCISTIL